MALDTNLGASVVQLLQSQSPSNSKKPKTDGGKGKQRGEKGGDVQSGKKKEKNTGVKAGDTEKGKGKRELKDSGKVVADGPKADRKGKKDSKGETSKAGPEKIGEKKDIKAADKGKGKLVEGKAKEQEGSSNDAKKQSQEERETLRKEILSLGGDEGDVDWLDDVDEEESLHGGEAGDEDPKLARDLKNFMKGIGIDAHREELVKKSDANRTDEGGEDEDDDDEEGDSDDNDDEEGAGLEARTEQQNSGEDDEDEERDQSDEHDGEDEGEGEQAALTGPSTMNRTASKESNEIDHRTGHTKWLVDPHPSWYSIPLAPITKARSPLPDSATEKTLKELQARGLKLLQDQNTRFRNALHSSSKETMKEYPIAGLSSSDTAFIRQILTSGTSSDRLSALILLVSSSPLHCMSYLEQLLSMCGKKESGPSGGGREGKGRTVRGLVEWLVMPSENSGLPNRKLRWFLERGKDPHLLEIVRARQEATQKKGRSGEDGKMPGDEYLVIWAFEDWFKNWFFELLKTMENLSHDTLPFVRNQIVPHVYSLLKDKPEQEQNLLRLLVNKLGDTDRSVASKTSHLILQLLQHHPLMKTIVVREIASLVLRPRSATTTASATALTPSQPGGHVRFEEDKPKGSSKKKDAAKAVRPGGGAKQHDHATYYGVITLNQVMLAKGKDTEVANKLMDVYFEFFGDLLGRSQVEESKDPENEGEKEGEEQVGVKPERKRKRKDLDKVKAKEAVAQDAKGPVPDLTDADNKLMAAVLTGVNRAFPYAQIDEEAFKKRIDTLFKISHTGAFNVSIQALTLIFHVSNTKQAVSDRFYRTLYESLVDPRLQSSSKQAMYLNLLFKAIKVDKSRTRVKAFVKRILQSMGMHEPPFICGALYLLGELFNVTPGLREMLTSPESELTSQREGEEKEGEIQGSYDGRKREPQFSNAERTCLWELVPLLNHFHPSVALHASQLLVGASISTSPDLSLHTLIHFLDRFVYRNPKTKISAKGASMMQPGAIGQDVSGTVVKKKGGGLAKDEVVNEERFWKKREEDVPVDQLFFHRYFNHHNASNLDKAKKSEKTAKKKKSRRGEDSDESDEDIDIAIDDVVEGRARDAEEEDGEADEEEGDLAEDEIWEAMKASMPADVGDISDDEDEDEDEDLEDLELAMGDIESGDELEDGPEEEEMEMEGEVDQDEEDGIRPALDEEDDEDDQFGENASDVLDSDEEMPTIELGGDGWKSAFADEEEDEEEEDAGGKQKKKRKLKHLPTFASAEDYAAMLGDDDDSE